MRVYTGKDLWIRLSTLISKGTSSLSAIVKPPWTKRTHYGLDLHRVAWGPTFVEDLPDNVKRKHLRRLLELPLVRSLSFREREPLPSPFEHITSHGSAIIRI